MIGFPIKPHNTDTSKLTFFFFFLSSPSNETLTDIPTSNSIPVHCKHVEPEKYDDMYWNIPLDIETDDEAVENKSYPDVNSSNKQYYGSQSENDFPWLH